MFTDSQLFLAALSVNLKKRMLTSSKVTLGGVKLEQLSGTQAMELPEEVSSSRRRAFGTHAHVHSLMT